MFLNAKADNEMRNILFLVIVWDKYEFGLKCNVQD